MRVSDTREEIRRINTLCDPQGGLPQVLDSVEQLKTPVAVIWVGQDSTRPLVLPDKVESPQTVMIDNESMVIGTATAVNLKSMKMTVLGAAFEETASQHVIATRSVRVHNAKMCWSW